MHWVFHILPEKDIFVKQLSPPSFFLPFLMFVLKEKHESGPKEPSFIKPLLLFFLRNLRKCVIYINLYKSPEWTRKTCENQNWLASEEDKKKQKLTRACRARRWQVRPQFKLDGVVFDTIAGQVLDLSVQRLPTHCCFRICSISSFLFGPLWRKQKFSKKTYI